MWALEESNLRVHVALIPVVVDLVPVRRCGALSQRIRTAAEIPIEVGLIDDRPVPLYQQIAERAKHMRELGISNRTIGRVLGVSQSVVVQSAGWAERIAQGMRESNGDGEDAGTTGR